MSAAKLDAAMLRKLALSSTYGKAAATTPEMDERIRLGLRGAFGVPTVPDLSPLAGTAPVDTVCEACGERIRKHFVSRRYTRVYDLWSATGMARGLVCAQVRQRRLPPDEKQSIVGRPRPLGRPRGWSKERGSP